MIFEIKSIIVIQFSDENHESQKLTLLEFHEISDAFILSVKFLTFLKIVFKNNF